MGKMEYGKMIAGCVAALTTKTGKIGYLGPLINDETRRLASSVYLGAKYCWTNYLGKDASALSFKVTWIGFWFNIPGVTSDPTQVADDFYNSGYDVVISGIDPIRLCWCLPGRGRCMLGSAILQLGSSILEFYQAGSRWEICSCL
jgi:simple sugar transport system substrate-binding protein